MNKIKLTTALLLLGSALLGSPTHASGTWTKVAQAAPVSFSNMLLLTDGTVIGADGNAAWYRLTPDIHGSYVNGTWSQIASMHDTRLYYSVQVLQSGNVYVAGGEYGTGKGKAETYNPLTNVWTSTSAAPIGFTDPESQLLPNGTVLQSDAQSSVSIYNAITNSWSSVIHGPDQNEACWTKLADDSILTIDAYGQNSSRYIPATSQWVSDATVPVTVFGFGGELGSSHLLPNGKVFQIGATSNTAIYTPTGNTNPGNWVAGAVIPNSLGAVDAPAAMMTNGKILAALGITSGFGTATSFYEYDYAANSWAQVNGPTGTTDGTAPYTTSMVDLPDGSVLYQGTGLYEYMPSGTPLAAGKPVINSITKNGDGSYHLTGTGLNGISQGAKYGDDKQMDSNYPIVRLTNNSTGNVYYARTYNWSSTSVMTGSKVMTTEFTTPAGLPTGTYSLVVTANGNASASVSFPPSTGIPPTPTNVAASPGNGQVTVTWSASSGATGYAIYRSTTSGGEGTTPIATVGAVTSYTNTGLTNGTKYYYKVAASNSSGTSGQSSEVSATPTAGGTTFISINCGGAAASPFVADVDFSGGGVNTWGNAVDTSLLTGTIPPQAVLQSDREGTSVYTIPGMVANSSHTVTLYFVEQYWNAAGKRTFNVVANGTTELTNFDVFAAAGADFKAVQRSFTINANGSGQIVLNFNTVIDNAKVGGIVVN